jgi:quercetin dioxygenase-like cupin family protein
MTTATPTPTAPAPLWFLDTAVWVRVSADAGRNGLSMLESLAPQGDSPPLHVHTRDDELFHVLAGELLLEVGGEQLVLAEGETALAPAGVAHTYRVESAEARWLVVTVGGDFERFVRELSRPAEDDGLPQRTGPPTPEQAENLAAVGAKHGIEIVGPPL